MAKYSYRSRAYLKIRRRQRILRVLKIVVFWQEENPLWSFLRIAFDEPLVVLHIKMFGEMKTFCRIEGPPLTFVVPSSDLTVSSVFSESLLMTSAYSKLTEIARHTCKPRVG